MHLWSPDVLSLMFQPGMFIYQRLHDMIFTVRSGPPQTPKPPKLWNVSPKQVRQSPCLLLVSPSFGETKLPSNSASWRAFCALPAPGPSGTGNRCQGSVGWGLDWSFWLTSSRANMRLGNFFLFFKIDFRFKFGCQLSDDFLSVFLVALCPRRLHLDNWKKHSQEIPRSISRLGCCRA